MPQVWASYFELGAFLGMTAKEARAYAVRECLVRRLCKDGLTRVKLPRAIAVAFIASLPEFAAALDRPQAAAPMGDPAPAEPLEPEAVPLDEVADACVAKLREIHEALSAAAARIAA